MFIEVVKNCNVVFCGDAEDFLEDNGYNEDLEDTLVMLDDCEEGTKRYFEDLSIEKIIMEDC